MKKFTILLCAAALLAACSDSDDNNKTQRLTVGFEDYPAGIMAVDAEGSNFYTSYEGEQYTQYTDEESGLHYGLSVSKWGDNELNFSNGGTVFSTLNKELTWNDYKNQCTVFYKDPTTGYGGNKGSKVFAVIYEDATINFTGSEEHLIDHLWVINSAYTALAMRDGNDIAKKLSFEDEDYFYTTITGYDAAGKKTGSVDFYLGDFRTENSAGIIDEWTKVDLSSLGKVNSIQFTFDGSDKSEWDGVEFLNTPAYVCIDDIAIVKELQ